MIIVRNVICGSVVTYPTSIYYVLIMNSDPQILVMNHLSKLATDDVSRSFDSYGAPFFTVVWN